MAILTEDGYRVMLEDGGSVLSENEHKQEKSMSEFQSGTFNTMFRKKTQIGGDFPVWARTYELYQGGALVDTTGLKAGDVVGAGTMVIFNGIGKPVTIVKEGDTENYGKVNGFIFEDVAIPAGCTHATCAVVRRGRIYADRVATGIPTEVSDRLGTVVEFVRES